MAMQEPIRGRIVESRGGKPLVWLTDYDHLQARCVALERALRNIKAAHSDMVNQSCWGKCAEKGEILNDVINKALSLLPAEAAAPA